MHSCVYRHATVALVIDIAWSCSSLLAQPPTHWLCRAQPQPLDPQFSSQPQRWVMHAVWPQARAPTCCSCSRKRCRCISCSSSRCTSMRARRILLPPGVLLLLLLSLFPVRVAVLLASFLLSPPLVPVPLLGPAAAFLPLPAAASLAFGRPFLDALTSCKNLRLGACCLNQQIATGRLATLPLVLHDCAPVVPGWTVLACITVAATFGIENT